MIAEEPTITNAATGLTAEYRMILTPGDALRGATLRTITVAGVRREVTRVAAITDDGVRAASSEITGVRLEESRRDDNKLEMWVVKKQ